MCLRCGVAGGAIDHHLHRFADYLGRHLRAQLRAELGCVGPKFDSLPSPHGMVAFRKQASRMGKFEARVLSAPFPSIRLRFCFWMNGFQNDRRCRSKWRVLVEHRLMMAMNNFGMRREQGFAKVPRGPT